MDFLTFVQKMNAVADSGLAYGTGVFDLERYQQIKELLEAYLATETDLSKEERTNLLRPTIWYATPLSDVRAFLIKDDKVLLIQSAIDGKWALPGGYADVGETLVENVLKELVEEAGVKARVERLLAIFDTNKWQPQARQFYKNVFLCELESIDFTPNHEIAAVGWFTLEELPELSTNRITMDQLVLLKELAQENSSRVYIDDN